MFHAINALLARLARRIQARLARNRELAISYRWQVRKIRFGTYEYRDPRFDQLARRPVAVPVENESALYAGRRGGRS